MYYSGKMVKLEFGPGQQLLVLSDDLTLVVFGRTLPQNVEIGN